MKKQNQTNRHWPLVLASLILVVIVTGFVSQAVAQSSRGRRTYQGPRRHSWVDPDQVRIPGVPPVRTPYIP